MEVMTRRVGAEQQAQVCFWRARHFTLRSLVSDIPLSVIELPRCDQDAHITSFVLMLPVLLQCDLRTTPTELLVQVVDVVLEGSGIDEKFLGVTLFALVPNTTEFLNAISFAMNGNIALRWVILAVLVGDLGC